MKRRSFITTAFFSGLLAPELLPYASNQNLHPWLEVFLKSVNVKTKTKHFLMDKPLNDAYNLAATTWLKSGFKALGSDYFLCRNNQTALFPQVLSHPTLGQLDFAVLCFEKDIDGNWQPLPSFSSFQIEALSKASKDLSFKNLEDYFLPCLQNSPKLPFSFSTKKGYVTCKVSMSKVQTTIDATISDGENNVWQKQFFSEHRLNVQAAIA